MSDIGFRTILLILGGFFILAIYLWGKWVSSKSVGSDTTIPIQQQRSPDISLSAKDTAILDLAETIEELHNETMKLTKDDELQLTLYDQQAGARSSRQTHQNYNHEEKKNQDISIETDLAAESKKYLVLLLKAKSGIAFNGLDILSLTKSTGMKLSDVGVFNYYFDQQKWVHRRPLFSLANLYEPGEFDLMTLDKLVTQGLLFFMPLPSGLPAKQAVHLFYSSVAQFADELDGEILDQNKHIITQESLAELIQRAEKFS